jgi:hypothetical protein
MNQQNDYVIKSGVWYVEQFEKDNQVFIESVVKFKSIRNFMVMVYNALVASNKILPIDKLEKDMKVNFWSDAKEFAAGRLDNEDCIKLSKILYVLKVL